MLRSLRFAAAALLFLALPTLAQGPVVLMGIDCEDNNISGGNHGGLTPYTDVIGNGILPNVNNGGSGILVIGGGKVATDHVTLFWNALGASESETITYANGAAAISAQSFAGFAVIAIASSIHETPSGGLTDEESDALNTRSADIADHVNGGGGLFCTSQDELPTPYGYLGSIGSFTFNFPPQFDETTATTEGEAIGITDTNLDVCCWHDEYLTFPGFLDVLATNDDTGNPCAIGGTEVIIVQGIVLTPLTAVNVIGTNHTVTATVADNNGDPVVGTTVTFNVISGPNTGAMGMDVTDVNGQAFFTYSSAVIGLDTIEGCFTDNAMVVQCADCTKLWIASCQTYDFDTEDDFSTPLGNGQTLTTPPEFGVLVSVSAAGANLGMTTFDSTPGGPNTGSADADMLINKGNILMLQHSAFPAQTVAGFWDTPLDDTDGGDLIFDFTNPSEAQSVVLIDIDPAPNLGASVTLIDSSSLTRVYTVPAGWTGTFNSAPGWKSLDLTVTTPQVGNAPGFKLATASEMAGFDATEVERVIVHMTGRGAMDDLSVCDSDLGLPRASTAVRNGTGVNPLNLSSVSLPRLGGTWATNLDCSTQGSGTATLVIRRNPSPGRMTMFGERLVRGTVLYSAVRAHTGGLTQITWDIPADLALLGMDAHAQGNCSGSRAFGVKPVRQQSVLSNAIDLVIGF